MVELYNNHTYVKVFAGVILFFAFIFLIVLLGYQSGRNTVLSSGSILEPYGTMGEIIGELIIIILFVIGVYLMVYYFTLTNISKKLVISKEFKAVSKINPKDKKQENKMVNGVTGIPGNFDDIQEEIISQQQELNSQVNQQAKEYEARTIQLKNMMLQQEERKKKLLENNLNTIQKQISVRKDIEDKNISRLERELNNIQKQLIVSDEKIRSEILTNKSYIPSERIPSERFLDIPDKTIKSTKSYSIQDELNHVYPTFK